MNKVGKLLQSAKPVRSRLIVLVVCLIGILGAAPALARAIVYIDNFQIPYDTFLSPLCANQDASEVVHVGGTLHVLTRTTIDDRGGYHSRWHYQGQGVSGTGETTGDKYRLTGVTQSTFNGKVGQEQTYVNNFRLIGPGPGNNYLVHETWHMTVNANGEWTAYVNNYSVECK